MALPKIQYPTTTITFPDKTKSVFRPMLVREEKLLLMAKESATETDILMAIRQVVNNCSLDPKFDVDTLPLFALEYAFLKLRAFSISDVVRVSYKDDNDNKIYDFDINLEKVTVKYPEVLPEPVIKVTNIAGLKMKWPTAAVYADETFLKAMSEEDSFFKLVVRCIDQVYDGDKVYTTADFNEEELLEFVELLDIKSFQKIRDFLTNVPHLYYKIEYKNSLGQEGQVVLNSLADFFTLR
jgi:hypothetical protein